MDMEALKNSMPNLHSAAVSNKELFKEELSPADLEQLNKEEEENRISNFSASCEENVKLKHRVDFSDYVFRCSSIGVLMTGQKLGLTKKQEETLSDLREKMKSGRITENQIVLFGELLGKKNAKPELSTTAKNYLELLHKEEVFNRRYEVRSKYLDKGIQVEEQSLSLYTRVCNKLVIKNKTRFCNDYITGEPDNVEDVVRDFKSSWDFTTFPLYEKEIPTTNYYWQLQGYMELTGREEAELIYCLVDSPEMIVDDEIRRLSWKSGCIEVPEDLEKEIKANMAYKDIPESMRVKIFRLKKDPEAIKSLYKVIDLARAYLNDLSEKLANRLELK